MSSGSLYLEQFRALLPPGRIWPDEDTSTLALLLRALAERLSAAELRALDLLAELDPRSTTELIDDWERLLGLPDPCTPPVVTLQERRARVVQRLTVQPNPRAQYLIDLAVALGYEGATITETGPYEFTVVVPNPTVVYFRTGASMCGDLLGKINRAADLECLFNEEKPAHLSMIFSYAGS